MFENRSLVKVFPFKMVVGIKDLLPSIFFHDNLLRKEMHLILLFLSCL